MNIIQQSTLPHAFERLGLEALIRQQPEDFQVDEIPVVEAAGSGEHALLCIRKTGLNTEQVARQLAKFAEVKPMAVSYAGQKDRHAVTTQYFSVQLPGRPDPDWSELASEQLQVLSATRHNRKLKRGALKGNRFRIRLADFKGDMASLEQRVKDIRETGVPNYFGEQRFGRANSNLHNALAMFSHNKRLSRAQRSMALSAARSYLFNLIVAERIMDGSWNKLQIGDFAILNASHGGFRVEQVDDELLQRLVDFDIHPSAPLHGEGELHSRGGIADLEKTVLQTSPEFCQGLEKARLKTERRAMRLPVPDLLLEEDNGVVLAFSLSRGCFATSVLREILT